MTVDEVEEFEIDVAALEWTKKIIQDEAVSMHWIIKRFG
jgi:hypothetical protein